MARALNILLLAGSAEARQIAKSALARGHHVHALVSEPPRGGSPMPVPFTCMAFDDAAALVPHIAGVDAVVDASHGFDGAMTRIGHDAASLADVPFVRYARPLWSLTESPLWVSAPDVAAAMELIDPGARVFSAAGWASLKACAGFQGEKLFLRQTSPHDRTAPYSFVELVFGEAPFSVESEISTFRDLRIDTLMCRNLGGMPSRPKLDAAKALGLKVILIDPPEGPTGVEVYDDVRAVEDWIATQ